MNSAYAIIRFLYYMLQRRCFGIPRKYITVIGLPAYAPNDFPHWDAVNSLL